MIRRILLTLVLVSTAVVSANAQPFSHLFHLHPGTHAAADSRVTLHLYNDTFWFKKVMVDGKSYAVGAHGTLTILAPAGTPVMVYNNLATNRKTQVVTTISPEKDHANVVLN
jgi:hypothetical protein